MKPDFAVVFDLDGTLIDSQAAILGSIKTALAEAGVKNVIPLTESLIGPPLMETLAAICGTQNLDTLSMVASKFKEVYDREGFKQSIPYDGVDQMLETLTNEGFKICLATNKRHNPTIKILSHFVWGRYFNNVFAIDSAGMAFKDKAETIATLLRVSNLDPHQAVYVGDRYEDFEAAKNNNMEAILVDWGYSESSLSYYNGRKAKSITELISILKSYKDKSL